MALSRNKIDKNQWEFLVQLLGPSGHALFPEGGCLIETIKESKEPDLGTKLLYLERAISQESKEFNRSLDKLYSPQLAGEAKNQQLELIRSYKKINDICFNGRIKYALEVAAQGGGFMQADYGTVPILHHIFQRLGNQIVDEPVLQAEAKALVATTIQTLTAEDEKTAKLIPAQREARLKAETTRMPQANWRRLLDLPPDQLMPRPNVRHLLAGVAIAQGFLSVAGALEVSRVIVMLALDAMLRGMVVGRMLGIISIHRAMQRTPLIRGYNPPPLLPPNAHDLIIPTMDGEFTDEFKASSTVAPQSSLFPPAPTRTPPQPNEKKEEPRP